jgi:hypothetical protein
VSWACPKCKSPDLKVDVTIRTRARLIQEPDGNFQTDEDGGDHEWDGDSTMECAVCGHEDVARAFKVPDDYLALLRLAERLARMNYDGEEGVGPDGDDFDMSGDDAAGTLSCLIREAREVLNEE